MIKSVINFLKNVFTLLCAAVLCINLFSCNTTSKATENQSPEEALVQNQESSENEIISELEEPEKIIIPDVEILSDEPEIFDEKETVPASVVEIKEEKTEPEPVEEKVMEPVDDEEAFFISEINSLPEEIPETEATPEFTEKTELTVAETDKNIQTPEHKKETETSDITPDNQKVDIIEYDNVTSEPVVKVVEEKTKDEVKETKTPVVNKASAVTSPAPVSKPVELTQKYTPVKVSEPDQNQFKDVKNEAEISGLVSEINNASYENKTEVENKKSDKSDVEASRSLTMMSNQFLEVVYPGKGWVYLGEENDVNLVHYMGRKIGTSDTIFTMRTKNEGTTLLHFYKNDALTGDFIDDYLEVIIKGKSTSNATAKAPSYAEKIPVKPQKIKVTEAEENVIADITENKTQKNENSSSSVNVKEDKEPQIKVLGTDDSNSQTVINTTSSDGKKSAETTSVVKKSVTETKSPQQNTALKESSAAKAQTPAPSSQNNNENIDVLSTEQLLQKAKDFYASKKYADALKYVNEFVKKSTTRLDEAYFLKGQILEASSPVRNIKEALTSYETVVKAYPKSTLWQKANERATYIKRFYIDIR